MVEIEIYAEDGQWVAHHLPTGCASCGDTAGEAFANVLDAVAVYLATLADEAEAPE